MTSQSQKLSLACQRRMIFSYSGNLAKRNRGTSISRNLGMAKNTAKKYASAESPPTKKLSAKEGAKAETLAASIMTAD